MEAGHLCVSAPIVATSSPNYRSHAIRKFVAEHIARCQAQDKGPRLTWAIAGRSADKLQVRITSLTHAERPVR
jgi:hypothetical protein